MPRLKDFLELHFIIILWGFTAILGKFITIPAVELVFIRTMITALALAAIMAYNKTAFKVDFSTLRTLMFVGILLSAHWILFFASARVASVSISLAGLATSSLWTAILEPMFFKKKIKPHEILLALLVMVGLYIIFKFEFDHAIGIAMAVGSAFCGALFTIINSHLTKQHPSTKITSYEMAAACIVTALFFPVYTAYLSETGSLDFSLNQTDIIAILILSLVCTVYAFTASVRLMQKITAYAMNLTVNLEPLYGILLAWLIFGDSEKMSTGFYYGAAVILLSVFIYPILDSYVTRREKLKASLPDSIL